MSEKLSIRFDRERELAIIQSPSGPVVELNETEYNALLHELVEVCGTGWAIIHRIEREKKLKEYIREHPGCRYIEIMDDIGDPENHMGYMSVTCSLTNLVDKGILTVTLAEDGKRMYTVAEKLI